MGARVSAIPANDYLEWVQRSLNRILGANLTVDGRDTAAYRVAVQRFNETWSQARSDSRVDEATQDELIAHSYLDPGYVAWIQGTLGSALGLTLGAGNGILDADTVKATKLFQHKKGLRPDGWVGAKTETALIAVSDVFPPESTRSRPIVPSNLGIPPRGKPAATALTRNQIRLFVWVLIAEEPQEMTAGKLATEFADFTGLKALLKKPSLVSAFRRLGATYWHVVSSEFSAEPHRQYGFLVGQTYAIVDAATRITALRRMRPSERQKLRQFGEGFNGGYAQSRGLLASVAGDGIMAPLMEQLGAAKPTFSLRAVYGALFEILKPKLRTMAEQQYFAAAGRDRPSFAYPAVRVRPEPGS